ncbi:MAG: DUF1631 domain-containing protein [Burkholderiaceae bacterium]|nr:DUF1631 domain-containing protein [Burkholderiaceae bacterium]
MHTSAAQPHPQQHLARQARQMFVAALSTDLVHIDQAVLDFLTELMSQTATQRDMQTRRDAWMLYDQLHGAWTQGTARVWALALAPAPVSTTRAPTPLNASLELLSDDVVENKIVASRMALTVLEAVSTSFDTLRRRIQLLEGQELASSDILRPETLCLRLVEQWVVAGLPRANLQMVIDPLQRALAERVQAGYQAINDFLAQQGVAQQDVRLRVTRPGVPATNVVPNAALSQFASAQDMAAAQAMSAFGPPTGLHHRPTAMGGIGPSGAALPMTGITPLARARQRAYGVMGQLRRLMGQQVVGMEGMFPPTGMAPALTGMVAIQPHAGTSMGHIAAPQGPPAPPATAALEHALAEQRMQASTYYSGVGPLVQDVSPAAVVQLVGAVRERSAELKKKAGTDSEKAIIEVVALMFQSILSEDRIPSAVRVWFARLQVPVLRVALAEPEFFSDLNHPARLLIDRMGACALGFDSTSINGSALEAEIRRVVQVIEQYPETGSRVFQLVREEFEAFLAKFLTEKQSTSRVVTIAQQMEQKETLTIQYTIELRNLLKEMSVRDDIRDFLFKTWAEVLALSAVRLGAQHPDTLAFKHTAADLVWAASAKPNRNDRAQVIQGLPGLLERLRQGLALVGIEGESQDVQIKAITDTLGEAFLSKTATIAREHIDAMARRLENLEDFMTDPELGEMPLDAESIEMMLGIDASTLHVVADNGAPVEPSMLDWAGELQPGVWFTLDHNGVTAQVQYVWHSQRKQLHLFAAVDGHNYLLQRGRLAAYLQAGLLVAQEDEGLTERAARDALTKLDANPERLLH